jgi:hypothetical protein
VPIPTPPPTVAQGTLVVQAGVDGADVLIDGKRVGATDGSGNLRVPLVAKQYAVRVEKPGYQGAAEQRVSVAKDAQQQVSFRLTAQPATLTLRGATAGAQVKVGGRVLGTVGGDGSFTTNVTPGDATIELSKDQFQPRSIARRFEPGKTVTVDRNESTLTAIPKVDPNAAVAQEWERVKNSRDVAQLEDFLKRNRNTPFAKNAEERLGGLRWDAVDKKSIASLRDFAGKNPTSPYAKSAEEMAMRLQLDAAARTAKENEQREQKALADRKLADDRAKADRMKTERAAILQTLARFTGAISQKNLKEMSEVYPSVPVKNWRDSFAMGSVTLTLKPLADPEISENGASVACERSQVIDLKGKAQSFPSQRVRVNLARKGDSWIIQSIQ